MIVFIGIAGGCGAVARYWLDTGIKKAICSPNPFSTAVINVLGSFILGLIVAAELDPMWSAVLGLGLCGGFTTFSTASVEVGNLLLAKRLIYGLIYGGAMCVLCALAAGLGIVLVSG
ncbi:fluoride efflux transporter FluC [Arcanobacterium pinnipediorum]|uniref:Fluoride-specific ion channel FluC n=1 Tax=Arcanobacterium pinnipediorum TaxID=1503041 RepID=A0ABY5AFF6_9ACTO|nr:CrcB family protein [Arcanobacterium pinnipediorum]USR78787.1 CrcB family protein [Arcanobacterium pinnipediorum]